MNYIIVDLRQEMEKDLFIKHGKFQTELSDTSFLADQSELLIYKMLHNPFFMHISFLRPHPPLSMCPNRGIV